MLLQGQLVLGSALSNKVYLCGHQNRPRYPIEDINPFPDSRRTH